MFGLVPIRSELVWSADVNCTAIERERLGRLQPCSECLVGQFLPCALKKARPGFLRGKGHSCDVENSGGGAKLDPPIGNCNRREMRHRYDVIRAMRWLDPMSVCQIRLPVCAENS